MRMTTKFVFAGLAAAIVLSLAIGDAAARRISTTEQGFLVLWTELVYVAGGNRISCPVTLEGSFHSKTISKACGSLVGYITRAQVPTGVEPPCKNGTATALTETLPWHIGYNSFAGVLPSITRIRLTLVGARYQIRNGGVTCLAGTTQANPGWGDLELSAEAANRLKALPEFGIPLGGEFLCGFAGNSFFEGTGEVFSLATPRARLDVRLVQ